MANNNYVHSGNLYARKKLLDCIRSFFDERDYLEVDTPLAVRAPALEDYIEAPSVGERYLRTSPELHMKRLLGTGLEGIYQLGPCFRQGEMGKRHLPEFTMLEWYRTGADCYGILEETVELLNYCAAGLGKSGEIVYQAKNVSLSEEWETMTVDQAFSRFAHTGESVDELLKNGKFEITLTEKVEPCLGQTRPTVLCNFPASLSSLARQCPDNPERVERWELFIAGMEIANAYTELTDYREQLRRFQATRELRKAAGRKIYPNDNEYLQLLKRNDLPECGGIALGVDRLLMLLTDAPTIQQVVPFATEM
ncbi:MAG: EF-P lysine aminoacylase EpmA [Lentisphaeria bacterium]